MTDNNVGKRLKLLRSEKGLTLQETADALGMPKTTYAHYEDGSNEPKISVLIKLSIYYGISVDWIIGLDEPQKSSPPEDKWEALRNVLEQLPESDVKEVWSFVRFLLWRKNQPQDDQ